MSRAAQIERIDGLNHNLGFRSRQIVNRARQRVAPRARSQAALARLADHASDLDRTDAPIFVLGAGWRTGSTMLQRMLNAIPGTLIWGEPYSEGAPVQRLSESLAFLDPERGRFHGRVFPDDAGLPSRDEWTANLTPPLDHLVQAHRAMLDRLFRQPAVDHNCPRWGVKEVVWGHESIDLLSLLYPSARFLLLVRDPQTQWRSYRPKTRRPWFYRWPESPIGGPLSFGRMWTRLVGDFVAADQNVARATVVRYEDLTSFAELERLTDFLELEVPLHNDVERVGSSRDRAFFAEVVPAWERAAVRHCTAEAARLVGYE